MAIEIGRAGSDTSEESSGITGFAEDFRRRLSQILNEARDHSDW
jgi:hypothetical protein